MHHLGLCRNQQKKVLENPIVYAANKSKTQRFTYGHITYIEVCLGETTFSRSIIYILLWNIHCICSPRTIIAKQQLMDHIVKSSELWHLGCLCLKVQRNTKPNPNLRTVTPKSSPGIQKIKRVRSPHQDLFKISRGVTPMDGPV